MAEGSARVRLFVPDRFLSGPEFVRFMDDLEELERRRCWLYRVRDWWGRLKAKVMGR